MLNCTDRKLPMDPIYITPSSNEVYCNVYCSYFPISWAWLEAETLILRDIVMAKSFQTEALIKPRPKFLAYPGPSNSKVIWWVTFSEMEKIKPVYAPKDFFEVSTTTFTWLYPEMKRMRWIWLMSERSRALVQFFFRTWCLQGSGENEVLMHLWHLYQSCLAAHSFHFNYNKIIFLVAAPIFLLHNLLWNKYDFCGFCS